MVVASTPRAVGVPQRTAPVGAGRVPVTAGSAW
jgi:hypothetical protein